jgi:hypothetical protein
VWVVPTGAANAITFLLVDFAKGRTRRSNFAPPKIAKRALTYFDTNRLSIHTHGIIVLHDVMHGMNV